MLISSFWIVDIPIYFPYNCHFHKHQSIFNEKHSYRWIQSNFFYFEAFPSVQTLLSKWMKCSNKGTCKESLPVHSLTVAPLGDSRHRHSFCIPNMTLTAKYFRALQIEILTISMLQTIMTRKKYPQAMLYT